MSVPQPVMSVTDITGIALLKSNPPGLIVTAKGLVPTSDWISPALVPREVEKPPVDGILEFDFVAVPPLGKALQVITCIVGHGTVHPMPDWVRGVRIHSATNSVEELLSIPGPAIFETDLEELSAGFDPQMALAGNADVELIDPDADDVVLVHAEEVEGAAFTAITGKRCDDFRLLSISGWPEVKTEFENKCLVKIGGKCKVKTKVPVLYRRTSKLTVFAQVCYPDEHSIKDDIEDCLKQAVAAGILAGIVTGNLAAFAKTLQTYLVQCLNAKIGKTISGIDVSLRREKVPGPWKRI